MENIVGIDFGTTNTVAAIITYSGPKIILDHEGNKLTPSVVAKENGVLQVGYEAKENSTAFGLGNAVKEVKRKIGTDQTIMLAGQQLKPFEIASLILKKVKRNVDINLGEHVKKAIITVPAQFSDAQKNDIMHAGKIAGFEVEKIINEPTAAIMAYVYRKNLKHEKVLCYDFGGGTFDLSIADIKDGNVSVKCIGGDRHLGGADIDQTFLEYIKKQLELKKNCKLSKKGLHQLSLAIEKAKIDLSKRETASINSKFSTNTGEVSYFVTISRATFESLIYPHIDKTMIKVQELLDENGINPINDIDSILLVGGSSRIPLISKKLKSIFPQKLIAEDVDAEVSVAIGAALEANNKLQNKVIGGVKVIQDVSPYSIGLKIGINGRENIFDPIIRKNFPYGREYSEKYDTAIDYQKTMLLQIYQGDHPIATDNEHITDFEIDEIPEREAGKESVKVSFMYDENGIIKIRGTILSTGKQVHKAITYKNKVNDDQVENSKTKIKEYFTSEKQFNDALKLKETLKTFHMNAESNELDEALKRDDALKMEKMKVSLLDD